VRQGQAVTFTVDAYPESTFTGTVEQVRNAPITVQNVVTYDAVVAVSNPRLQLRPGMTANVSFIIAKRDGALKVPNAALRFQPDGAAPPPAAAGGRDTAPGDRLQAQQRRLTEALALTDAQQAQLEDLLQKARQQGMRLREQGGSDEELRARRREQQTQTRAQIRSILTEAQRQKYEELLKTVERQREEASASGRPGRLWVQQADSTLQPLTVQLGISDETFTEVMSGDLQEGQEVVTGVLAGAKRAVSTPPGFGQRAF
jgi:HlyD family secretion protein